MWSEKAARPRDATKASRNTVSSRTALQHAFRTGSPKVQIMKQQIQATLRRRRAEELASRLAGRPCLTSGEAERRDCFTCFTPIPMSSKELGSEGPSRQLDNGPIDQQLRSRYVQTSSPLCLSSQLMTPSVHRSSPLLDNTRNFHSRPLLMPRCRWSKDLAHGLEEEQRLTYTAAAVKTGAKTQAWLNLHPNPTPTHTAEDILREKVDNMHQVMNAVLPTVIINSIKYVPGRNSRLPSRHTILQSYLRSLVQRELAGANGREVDLETPEVQQQIADVDAIVDTVSGLIKRTGSALGLNPIKPKSKLKPKFSVNTNANTNVMTESALQGRAKMIPARNHNRLQHPGMSLRTVVVKRNFGSHKQIRQLVL
jgi:hypothetical protein